MSTQKFTVVDGYRRITFIGSLLSRASSKRPGVWRWTDLALYRTEAGTYVLEKIGASRVTHVADCDKVIDDLPRFQEMYPGRDPDEDEFLYCDCVPDIYDFPSLLVERDRCWAQISNSAPSVVRSLMRYRDGSRWLPRTSVQLLSRAAELDTPIRNAYLLADSVIA
jgi:hypothetical protein